MSMGFDFHYPSCFDIQRAFKGRVPSSKKFRVSAKRKLGYRRNGQNFESFRNDLSEDLTAVPTGDKIVS